MSQTKQIENYFDRLWPICRSITGNGLRDSFKILKEIIPLEIVEIPSGTAVFDWKIPLEWNIDDAYIVLPNGEKIAEFKKNNLHVLNYSTPVNTELSYEELLPHLNTLPGMPDAIPYLTSYYKENWGFCLTHNVFRSLPTEGKYKVFIDSRLEKGSLTYGDYVLKGKTDREILFSTYLCHPSMANNELSGPLVLSFLYRKIAELPDRKFTYRFVVVPETIGCIAYLNKNGNTLKSNLEAGYVITCAGDRGDFTYKRSKESNSSVNRVAEHILRTSGKRHSVIDFAIGGSDERQYCSPGFNLPVGSLMRTMYQRYPEYHTSLDNKDFISFQAMEETIDMYFSIVRAHEMNEKYSNTNPFCEPNLGKRGLYVSIGGLKQRPVDLSMRLHLLSYADGNTDLLDIAEKYGISLLEFENEIALLSEHGLLKV